MTQIIAKSPAYIAARNKLGDHRKVFDSITDALVLLRVIYASEGFPKDFPTVAAGVGSIDLSGEDTVPPLADWPVEYTGTQVAVSFIGVRGIETTDAAGKKKESNGARGFMIYPLYSIDAIRQDESGDKWLWKIIEKELSHVAARPIRSAGESIEALGLAAQQMPLTVSDYVEESDTEGMDTTAFDGMWKDFKKMLSADPSTAALVPGLPQKGEVLKAIRSKPYATQEYEQLEAIGTFRFIGETMANIIDHLRAKAVEAGEEFELDSTEIRNWLNGRDTKTFAGPRKPATVDLNAVNFANFMKAPSAA